MAWWSTGGTMDFHHDPDNPGFSFKTASIELDIKQDNRNGRDRKTRSGKGKEQLVSSREGAQEVI